MDNINLGLHSEKYELMEIIGQGGFASVHLIFHRQNKEKYLKKFWQQASFNLFYFILFKKILIIFLTKICSIK